MLIASISNRPAGVVRLDKDAGKAVISFQLSPKFVGRGLAKSLVAGGILEALSQNFIFSEVVAIVKVSNTASRKALEGIGFQPKTMDGEFLTLTLGSAALSKLTLRAPSNTFGESD